jgi:hypothetical protein
VIRERGQTPQLCGGKRGATLTITSRRECYIKEGEKKEILKKREKSLPIFLARCAVKLNLDGRCAYSS